MSDKTIVGILAKYLTMDLIKSIKELCDKPPGEYRPDVRELRRQCALEILGDDPLIKQSKVDIPASWQKVRYVSRKQRKPLSAQALKNMKEAQRERRRVEKKLDVANKKKL